MGNGEKVRKRERQRPGTPAPGTPAPLPAGTPPPGTPIPTPRVVVDLEPRQARLLDLALVLAVLALGFLVADDLARLFGQTSDLILTFFLAWLVAFMVGPVVDRLTTPSLRLPRLRASRHRPAPMVDGAAHAPAAALGGEAHAGAPATPAAPATHAPATPGAPATHAPATPAAAPALALPRAVAVILVYLVVFGVLGTAFAVLAATLAQSITDFVEQLPDIQARLPEILAPFQARLSTLGLQVNLATEADKLIANLGAYAAQLVGPLQSVAVASLSVLGTTLLIVILSIYIALDAPQIRAFIQRLVPPGHQDEWARFEDSVGTAFGGFIRGQVILGLIYGVVAAVTSLALGLPFAPATSAASALLQAIPFFGPFVSWAPPVLVAVFTRPDAIVPTLVAMGVGWFVVMNVLQPRLMQASIGLHPIVVLGSVLVGSKMAGIAGAIFGIPIAAVLTAMFFHYFRIFGESGRVTARAAARLEARDGRPVRVPREPVPGVDEDVEPQA